MAKPENHLDLAQFSLNQIAASTQLQRNLIGRAEKNSRTHENDFVTITITIERTRRKESEKN